MKEIFSKENIKSYLKDSQIGYENYNKSAYQFLYKLEETYFWFKSRNKIIRSLIQKYYNKNRETVFLEIGCGTGYVLKGLANLGNMKLIGADIHFEGLEYVKKRLPYVELIQLDANDMPFNEQFDYIGAFDVLEHIDDDLNVIENIYRALKKGDCYS